MKKNTSKALLIGSIGALLVSSQAFSHTGVKEPIIASVAAGTASYNAFTITHGCASGSNDQQYPVIGQVALFPFGPDAVWRNAATGTQTNGTVFTTPPPIAGVTDAHTGVTTYSLNLVPSAFASASSSFVTTREIVDNLGNVRAILWKDGALEPKQGTLTQFKVTAPAITDNCVSAVKVRLGVINFCENKKNASNDAKSYTAPKDAFGRAIPKTYEAVDGVVGLQTNVIDKSPVYKSISGGNGDNNRADWWFYDLYPSGSALYNDPDLLEEVTASKYWTTMTISNTDANLAKCTGTKTTVTVEPPAKDFDSFLTGPNTQPFTSGDSNF